MTGHLLPQTSMRGSEYYTDPEYHRYLLSSARRELFPARDLLTQLRWTGVENLLDFGMGNGFFLPFFFEFLGPEAEVWGAECQEELIDAALQTKVRGGLSRFIPFHIERTEHPLLPDWIPEMDIIFCCCVLSTFADPALAIHGIGRGMTAGGHMVIIDWEKRAAPSGPELDQKVSRDRMAYFVEDAGYEISRSLQTNNFLYGLEVIPAEGSGGKDETPASASRAPDIE